MAETHIALVTPAMQTPTDWLESILETTARGVSRFLGIIQADIDPLVAAVAHEDLSAFYAERMAVAKKMVRNLVANGSDRAATIEKAEQLAGDWIDSCVAPDPYNRIGVILWTMGTAPGTEAIISQLH